MLFRVKRSWCLVSCLTVCLAAATCSYAQTLAAIETELQGYLKTMAENGSYSGSYDEEKLNPASDALKQKLMKYATRADVLRYPFPKLKGDIFITTSKDGNLRIYSWDLQTGGTMHDFDAVYQYRGKNGKVYAWTMNEDEEDYGGGGFYHDIFQVDTPSGPIYLTVSTSIASTSLSGASVNAVRINAERLEKGLKVFKTKEGLTNSIGFAYDFFSVVDRPERPIKLFIYNAQRKELRFPVVIEDEKTPQGRITNRFITYGFDGKHFVKVG